ncbi:MULTISPECIES: LysM peptidoglycan-binding domain-containing protein [Psychrilyobacter]|uniref:LysM peptidoglycan-binding domain-containing protein n=1 Tax=Psychrilyobacter piezotolerans TaxID=2293438 RepID=A0ABX9KFH1_9FUSO|nr:MULTISPECIES: LysM domain-containing protein [Psychrilyobacter]MCS5421562.1 LysM peptidoglycan-binding domain-containing protein [Psychrilyobacter sp. S5]NDI78594.1 LysM peptidoglycan-binding domain-containing protein [Psychrilyobacter piezotolerans]RDE60297.1 LysM domain-containing protein [Psychrilyobacter sp. S5]REI40405.1 LysM peptidoglycan-binding domain-containing protein [Psychrilyobacter piezotolerans]
MKKLLILLAALSLVACSSNEPKEDMTETAPVVTEVVVEETPEIMEKTPMVEEEDTITGEAPATMEKTPMVEEEVMVEDVPMADEAPISYTVVEGDNLFQIGLKYNMSWERLAEENNISNPDVIEVGQVLTIPAE